MPHFARGFYVWASMAAAPIAGKFGSETFVVVQARQNKPECWTGQDSSPVVSKLDGSGGQQPW